MGLADRLSEGRIRLGLVDGAASNPSTVMPAYYRVSVLKRVARSVRANPFPMETGFRRDDVGKAIRRSIITRFTCTYAGSKCSAWT